MASFINEPLPGFRTTAWVAGVSLAGSLVTCLCSPQAGIGLGLLAVLCILLAIINDSEKRREALA